MKKYAVVILLIVIISIPCYLAAKYSGEDYQETLDSLKKEVKDISLRLKNLEYKVEKMQADLREKTNQILANQGEIKEELRNLRIRVH